jgi:carboxylesterase type B
MTVHKIILVIITAISYAFATDACAERQGFTVRTSTGRYTGLRNSVYENVREFRNIPYAEAPVGRRRWMPPEPVRASNKHTYSYRFGPSCPQFMPGKLSVWNSNITEFMINTGDQAKTSGLIAQTSSEDCLGLAIWTPANISSCDRLPVAFFIHGGSFLRGGITPPYQSPAGWISRSQKHIFVQIKYRLNVLGFPGAAGLEEQNLGLLDQRTALEWVYTNIEAFGGDRDRITVWGHSAGAVSVDMLNFAFHDNPLAAGWFLESGTTMGPFPPANSSNFTHIARNLGCDFPNDPSVELDCMRTVPVSEIVNFMGKYEDNGTKPIMIFKPFADERIVFNNYTERALQGLISKPPALISATTNEVSSLYDYPEKDINAGLNQTDVDRHTLRLFVCPAVNATEVRSRNNLTTYRYQYAGNFSSNTPLWWMGAYHAAEVPLIFGTYNISGKATDYQRVVAETMQDYIFAFLADPANGLREKGWMPQNNGTRNGGNMMRFALREKIVQSINSMEVDGACLGIGQKYNSNP